MRKLCCIILILCGCISDCLVGEAYMQLHLLLHEEDIDTIKYTMLVGLSKYHIMELWLLLALESRLYTIHTLYY